MHFFLEAHSYIMQVLAVEYISSDYHLQFTTYRSPFNGMSNSVISYGKEAEVCVQNGTELNIVLYLAGLQGKSSISFINE